MAYGTPNEVQQPVTDEPAQCLWAAQSTLTSLVTLLTPVGYNDVHHVRRVLSLCLDALANET